MVRSGDAMMPATGPRGRLPGIFGGGGRLSSTDLYFANACAPLLRRFHRRGPIRVLGPNSFCAGDIALIVRRDHPATVSRILSRPWRKLIYLVDDDIDAGVDDPGLPPAYRARLKHLQMTQYHPILHSADVVVTGSKRLADKHRPMKQVHVIDPYWAAPLPGGGHFDSLLSGGDLRLVHLGTASHRADLEAILPALERIMTRHRDVEFTTFYTFPGLERMAQRLRIRIRSHQSWRQHRKALPKERFHLALYPTLATAFNQARSINKLIEHGVVGAVGLYSAGWQHAHLVDHDGSGFLVGNEWQAWEETLHRILSRRERLRSIHRDSRELAVRLNDRDRQLQFWTGMFEL